MNYLSSLRIASVLICGLAVTGASHSSYAQNGSSASWVKDEQTPDKTAQIYLNPVFSWVSGKFDAVPESILDKTVSIEGKYLVGEYRYLFKRAEKGADGKLSDELVSTEILDCENNFFGTRKRVRRLKGKVVSDENITDADVTMIQTTMPNMGAKLCALHQHKKMPSLQPQSNPNYNPNPSASDIDKIIDKYMQPKAKGK